MFGIQKESGNPMKRIKMALQGLALVFLAVAVITGAPARGAVADTVALDMGAAVASSAQLTLGASAIHFSDADPDTVPSLAALENPLSVTASAQRNPKVSEMSLCQRQWGSQGSQSDIL
jgi:hypothetical protein